MNGKIQRNDKSLLDKESGGFCSLTKILVLLVLLGGGFGATFAFVGWDTIKGWFGAGDGSGGVISTDDEGAVEYQFIQCPEEGACCNGRESNCDLRVNEMLYATVHNA